MIIVIMIIILVVMIRVITRISVMIETRRATEIVHCRQSHYSSSRHQNPGFSAASSFIFKTRGFNSCGGTVRRVE